MVIRNSGEFFSSFSEGMMWAIKTNKRSRNGLENYHRRKRDNKLFDVGF
jgi:hypothetical protein